MKCFFTILIVLAFWPVMLDSAVRGRGALGLTRVFPKKIDSVGDAFNIRTAVLQVLPTPHATTHNNGGQSAGWVDSTILIWTGSQVTPDRGVLGIGHASLDLTHCQFQAAWSRVRHWWRVGSVWLVEATVTFILYLLFSITVAIVILSKPTVEQCVDVANPTRKPTFVEDVTRIQGSFDGDTHELVTRKQLPINTFTLEGRLVLCSGPSTSDNSDGWTVLFHPGRYYHPTDDALESRNRNTQLDIANKYLLNMLLRGVNVYHPWTWYLPGIVVDVPKEVFKDLHPPRKPTSVRNTTWIGGAPKSNHHGHNIQRRMLVTHAVRRPTFARHIDRHGGPPRPAVPEYALPKRPHNPAPWIEDFTLEGRLVAYAGSPKPDRPAERGTLFNPRSGYHLTRDGDESSGRQRDMADEYLLNILLGGSPIYHPWTSQPSIIILEVAGDIIVESNNLVFTEDSLDLIAHLYRPSSPGAPEFLTTINQPASSANPLVASIQLDASTDSSGPMVDSSPDALLHEQRAAHELRSLLPLLEDRTHQLQDVRAWGNAWTKVSEQGRVEVAGMEEDDQQEEVHQRRKRRGGKRNMAWKNKRRQQKDDNERNPEAGPSGLP